MTGGGLALLLVALVVLLVFTYLPAVIIFLVLDRYRPGRYTPRKRWLRLGIYLIVLFAASRLLASAGAPSPWLLQLFTGYLLPVPLYYLLRRLFY